MANIFEDILNSISGKYDTEAENYAKQAANLLAQGYTPEQIQYMGDYTAQQQGNTEYGNITEDPALRNAQINALTRLTNIANQADLTAEDRSKLMLSQQNTAQQEKASRDAILQNARARGVGGTGLELAQQIANQQSAANTNANTGLEAYANMQQRVAQALTDSANQASSIRGQDYGVASDKARAQDVINQFNTQNTNQANLRNIETRQNIAGQNTASANQALRDKYQGSATGAQNMSNYYQNKYNQGRQDVANAVGAGIDIASGRYGNLFNRFGNKKQEQQDYTK